MFICVAVYKALVGKYFPDLKNPFA